MFGFLVFIGLVASALLIGVVLLQNSKGSGLAGSFGGSAVGTMFGVRRTSDFLMKATWALAITLIAVCLLSNIFFLGGGSKGESVIQKGMSTVPQPSAPRSTPAAQPAGK